MDASMIYWILLYNLKRDNMHKKYWMKNLIATKHNEYKNTNIKDARRSTIENIKQLNLRNMKIQITPMDTGCELFNERLLPKNNLVQ